MKFLKHLNICLNDNYIYYINNNSGSTRHMCYSSFLYPSCLYVLALRLPTTEKEQLTANSFSGRVTLLRSFLLLKI